MFRYVKKYWYFALAACFFMIGEVLVDLMQPRMMAGIVDDGILGVGNGGVPDVSVVSRTGLAMILLVFLGGACGIICGIFTNLCSQQTGNLIRKDCFKKIMYFSFEQTDRFTIGSLITRVTSDVTQVVMMISMLTRGFVRCLMFLAAGSFALVMLSEDFGIVIAIAMPVILLEVVLVMWKAGPLFGLLQRRLDRMNTVVQENIAGARVVKAFVQEENEKERFETVNNDLAKTQFNVLLLMSVMRPVMNIVLNLAVVAVIKIGAAGAADGSIAPGKIIASVTYLTQILNSMMMLVMIFQSITRGMTSSKRLIQVLESENPIAEGLAVREEASDESLKGSVEFRNVSFGYPDSADLILHDIDLSVKRGETVAIIGNTGCGKSSLVRLLPRFYDVRSGSVLLEGKDVREYPTEQLREKISFVLQKSELFHMTIAENIRLGREDASMEDIRHAAAAAQADDFIMQQENGYDTMVTEGGMSLSGGQRQRVAIARALVKNAPVLILDDSTSALDFATEARLRRALKEEYPDVTIIMIAQRIVSVKDADRIVLIEDGTIAACGTHDELMAESESYRDICRSQIGEGVAS